MPRYKILIEYLGTNYAGWQKQELVQTIQGSIEDALFAFCAEKVKLFASGRTDAGVHALGQVAHFNLSKQVKTCDIMRALNFYLKNSNIAILAADQVNSDFDARFSAIRRHYIYKIINRSAPIAIEQGRALLITRNLQIDKMQQAAQYFIGQHDFTSFRSSECVAKSSIKTIYQLDIIHQNLLIEIKVCANSFLHHMVRNIVGTLLLVGDGKIEPEFITAIIQGKSRALAGPTAPAAGLYLAQIDY